MKGNYLKYILALLLFGTNGIVANHIHISSYEIVLLRTLTGSILLLALYLLTKHKFTFYNHKQDLLYIIISGIAMGASWMFLYEAYSQIGVSIASLLYYCGPVIVMILSPLLFHEKLTAVKVIGFLAVLIGIFFVNGHALESMNSFGMICGLLSALMYSIMVLANKKATHIVGMENSLLQLTISFLTVAIFVGIKNHGYIIQVSSRDWIWIIILGVVNTGIGCYLYFSSIGNLPVQTVAILGYLEPLSAVLFSVLLLGEIMQPLQVLGAIFIIGGAIFGECMKQRTDKSFYR